MPNSIQEEYNNIENNETQVMNQYRSGDIPEEINQDTNNNNNNNIKKDIIKETKSVSQNANIGDTDEIEEVFKD